LTVQICEITGGRLPITVSPRNYEQFSLSNKSIYFNIKDDSIGAETSPQIDAALGGTIGNADGRYGIEYFNNVYYGANKVQIGRNVQSATFAWKEIELLHDENFITGSRDDDAKFSITFSSASDEADLSANNLYSEFPHAMVIFMKYDQEDCLEDGNTTLGNFQNRASDYNTLCPRRCKEFLCPVELIPRIE